MLTLENWRIQEETGYQPLTTFYTDFSIAELYGTRSIAASYEEVFAEWKTSKSAYKYLTELAMVLNWKCWRWWKERREWGELYKELWQKLDAYLQETLKGEELEYYYSVTD